MPYVAHTGTTSSLVMFFVLLIMASMWNLLAGFGGMVSIGQQAFVGIGAYSVLAFFTPRLPFTVPRLCPFYLATGRDCPLCGLTRGLGLIAQGRVQEAFGKYPRALLVGLAGTGIAVWLFWKQASSQMKEAACRLIYKH
jgi:ABC-type branched-subunit amino acid transport system permease subunit